IVGERKTTRGYGFGTFQGVFTPAILTILGVVMYLRFGWVLGSLGPFWTVVVVTLASSVTFITALSLSALATNMKVEGGGSYHIISRSLGLETGAAIGLPLFFAQAFGISFYCAGFAEALVGWLEIEKVEWITTHVGPAETVIGIAALIVLLIVVYISANLALKIQFLILALIFGSLLSFFIGDLPESVVTSGVASEELHFFSSAKTFPAHFWMVFAVFFPAVTGIEAGIAMSGDLKNPAKSLPLGILSAIIVSYLVYIAVPLYMGAIIPYHTDGGKALLLQDSMLMVKVAKWGFIVVLAIWGASISSAMGTLLGAPRTLQALARDGILPAFIKRGYGKTNDPLIATGIASIVGICGLLLGGIDYIAPVLSMFFLTSYCLLNLSSAFEGMIGSPTWRPAFKVHWSVSLAGSILCLLIMIKIDSTATLVAILVVSTIYYIVKRRRLIAHWGDTRYGVLMLAAQNIIYRLASKKQDERTWRPNILVMTGSPTSRWGLVEMGNSIAKGNGFLTIATVVSEKDANPARLATIEDTVSAFL
ncbi:MAG: amino acid permease, partial [Victivallales bacterium]|nr:amino acid permease [Victivallales bacterium]